MDETKEQLWTRGGAQKDGDPAPALLVVFSVSSPKMTVIPVPEAGLAIGRGAVGDQVLEDECMSRRHALVTRAGAGWCIRDLGSRNGLAIDGTLLGPGEAYTGPARVLRVGDSLFLLCQRAPSLGPGVEEGAGGVVLGPALRDVWAEIAEIARARATLHVTGETGSGKELAARWFHASGESAAGPFVAVNCAAIPQGLAERLLFGARRGAYSGADTDSDGYVQMAEGGTLFLDEIAELDMAVQAKLLRVIETREVQPLGAAKPRRVRFCLCSATNADLPARVSAGTFREDLYFRIGRPEIAIPPLRDRPEDVPWLAEKTLRPLRMHPSLAEVALLRPWPGNVRELILELSQAARAASRQGLDLVEARHLAPRAGLRARSPEAADASEDRAEEDEPVKTAPSRDVIVEALRRAEGNVARAARALHTHRTQLRRWIARHGIEPASLVDKDEADE